MESELDIKVVRRAMDRQTADILRQQILTGQLPPGTRLVETQLAKQVHVSRGTVRSALSELAHQGLVQQVAYTKWQVPELSAQDAWEIYTLRSVLEGFGAKLAAESQSTDKLPLLTKSLKALVSSIERGHKRKAAEADFGLHRTIMAISGHQRLMQQYDLIEQQVRRYMSFSDDVLIVPADIILEHEALVDALLDGDADSAERMAKTHNIKERQILQDHLIKAAREGADGLEFPATLNG